MEWIIKDGGRRGAADIDDSVADEMVNVYLDGFGFAGRSNSPHSKPTFTSPDAKAMWKDSSYVAVLRDPATNELLAFGGARVQPLQAGGVLFFRGKTVIRKRLQNSQLSSTLLSRFLAATPEATHIGGKTQDPRVMSIYARHDELRPFTRLYDADQAGRSLMEGLLTLYPDAKLSTLDRSTGIWRNQYRAGRLGDVDPDLRKPKVVERERFLSSHGFDRNNGDCVFVSARLHDDRSFLTSRE